MRSPIDERLELVVGDVDHGRADAVVQPPQLDAHVGAQRWVEVGQRLVEQEDGRSADEGAGQRHPLPLAAGELGRAAAEQLLAADELGDGGDASRPLGRRDLAHGQAEADVLGDVEVGEQGVGLEDHRDVALGGGSRA